MIKGSARGNQNPGKEALSVKQLAGQYPGIIRILKDMGVTLQNAGSSSLAYICEEAGVDPQDVFDQLNKKKSGKKELFMRADSLTVIPGKDKNGKPEYGRDIHIKKGEVIAIVGPTGSGKSQLLSDIEGLVQGDSPSRRKILINGSLLDENERINSAVKPIAQISQNMNYLLDLPVDEFLDVHIESRNVKNSAGLKNRVIKAACSLCGEPFGLQDRIVTLSGGQARALMIADSIFISKAPVILVDEIENAGIDRARAVDLLLKASSIALIATHDPLIALMAHKRIVLKNGGIAKIIVKSGEEAETLKYLKEIDSGSGRLKNELRSGRTLASDMLLKEIRDIK